MSVLEDWIKEKQIAEVECLIADMNGVARGKLLAINKLEEDSQRIPESILLQTITGEYCDEHEDIASAEDQDMLLKPDLSTKRLIPWIAKPTAQIIHDCYTLDGDLHPLSSRNVLKRVLSAYQEMGIKAIVAPEVEFYLLQKNINPKDDLLPAIGLSGRHETARQSYGIEAINEFKPVIDQLYDYCAKQDLQVDCINHETGAAQLEINFIHGDPLHLADQVFTFKRTMRQVALEHDMYATFMARPMLDEPGSSMHIHQSLVDIKTGKNIFINEDGKHSEAFFSYIAGLQKYTPGLLSFYAPNVNSYRRFQKYAAAPINMHWGYDNRTVGIRIPTSSAAATRIENRYSGMDANPYLAIAASLACGLVGIKQKLKAEAAYEGNACEEEITLDRTLKQAIDRLTDSNDVIELLGAEFVNAFRLVKQNEFEEFNRIVTQWEREHLLLNV